jgi:hypothetical protein
LVPGRRRPLSATGFAIIASAAALSLASAPARAQTPTTGLLAPSLDGNPPTPPRFSPPAASPPDQPPPGKFLPVSTPIYGSPTGFGAGDTGYDSSNRPRRRRVAKTPASASQIAPAEHMTFNEVPAPPPQVPSTVPAPPAQPPPDIHPSKAANRPGVVLPPPPDPWPLSNPPTVVYPAAAAARPGAVLPIPPPEDFVGSASTPPPGTPPPNTLPLGTVPHGTLPIAGADPYEALGIKAGSFLVLPALEMSGGYNTNPQHAYGGGPGSLYYVVAPELHVRSDWSRHSFTADVSGSYIDYANNSFVPSLNVPFLNAKMDGRIDVLRDTQILLENRVIVSTDNPGSPNILAGLAKLPIQTTVGATLGVEQQFNRFDVTAKGTFDRSIEANAELTNGESASTDYRNFDQYGGTLRLGYELDPGLKPFVEGHEDERVYDTLDLFGEDRNSFGTSGKVGATLNLFGSLTGEMAAGYMARTYYAPLPNIGGATLDGSLLWQIDGLNTAKFSATSVVSESILQGVSGEFSRDVSIQVDHAFRRWLIGTLQIGYGRDEYVGLARDDNRYFVSGGITYKLNREVQLKASVRQDWLTSTATGAAYDATSFLLGLRLQR